jgi:regulator of sirC expression with transglutaminase-like and TPR domain
MKLNLKLPTPLDYFSTLVASDHDFPLLEASASLAQDDYPELSLQKVLGEVDFLLARLLRRLPASAQSMQRLKVLNQLLYQDMGFAGNFNHYADPDNSYVHRVLETRQCIPVSMAVIWLELARGIGLEAYGVSFPGHFMLKVHLNEGQVVIDPLTGHSLSQEALLEQLESMVGLSDGSDSLALTLSHHLHAASPRAIIARMLRNLKEIHSAEEDWPRLLAVQDRLLVLLPQAWSEYRDRGMTLAVAGLLEPAVRDLETYLAHAGPTADHLVVAARVADLRRTAH